MNCKGKVSFNRFYLAHVSYQNFVSHTHIHSSTSIPYAWAWVLSSLGLFLVKSFFHTLFKLSDSIPSHSVKFIWKLKVPFKVKTFTWLVAHKKIFTNDLLQLRRPSKALSLDWFILCRGSGETSDHLFLHCPFTLGLWHRLFIRAGMMWV